MSQDIWKDLQSALILLLEQSNIGYNCVKITNHLKLRPRTTENPKNSFKPCDIFIILVGILTTG